MAAGGGGGGEKCRHAQMVVGVGVRDPEDAEAAQSARAGFVTQQAHQLAERALEHVRSWFMLVIGIDMYMYIYIYIYIYIYMCIYTHV